MAICFAAKFNRIRRSEIIYFNMSQWGPYNVMLMRVRLVKIAQP